MHQDKIQSILSHQPYYHDVEIEKDVWLSDIVPEFKNKSGGVSNVEKVQRLIRMCGLLTDRTVLDIGCNAGGFLFECQRQSGVLEGDGIDVRQEWIDQARFLQTQIENFTGNLYFYKGDMEEIQDYYDDSYDIIFLGGIIYHAKNPLQLLEHAARVAKEVVYISTVYVDVGEVDGFLMHYEHPGSRAKKYSVLGTDQDFYWHPTSSEVLNRIMKSHGFEHSAITQHILPKHCVWKEELDNKGVLEMVFSKVPLLN